MLSAGLLAHLQSQLSDHFSDGCFVRKHGSSFFDTYEITGRNARYFLKCGSRDLLDVLHAEFAGLSELKSARAVRVPNPYLVGEHDEQCYLVLEYLALHPANDSAQEKLGQLLARQHEATQEQYGWSRSNTIGLTPQYNQWNEDWCEFFSTQRLEPQIKLLEAKSGNEMLAKAAREMQSNLDRYLSGDAPKASLLHGDLWSGNMAMLSSGEPVIFDPAVYYGDPESDIAMTEMFGGFTRPFYSSYRKLNPDTPDGAIRRELYRLYHWLNHCNLFGSTYHSSAMQSMQLIERGI